MMQTLTIKILNPKAKMLLYSLADLGLISIENEIETSLRWYENKEFVAWLEEDIELYKQGKLSTYSKEDIIAMVSNKKYNS